MNFDVLNSKVIPFNLSEKLLREEFLDFVIDGENTPLDVACNSIITEIKKYFYPVRCFNMYYSAEWRATSIWEHKEAYTEYQNKTVYIDYYGKEHNQPGFDYYYNGQVIGSSSTGGKGKKPWRVQQKTIPITKYKTVVDNIEETNGYIENQRSYQPIITYEKSADSKFYQWIVDLINKESYTDSTDEILSGCEIVPLVNTDNFAKQTAESNVQDIAINKCRRSVPGSRYENLKVNIFDLDSSMEIVLLPVYKVKYVYQSKEYECWHGGIRNSNFFYYSKPQDAQLTEENERYSKEIKDKKSLRLKLCALAFLAVPVALFFGFILRIARSPFGDFLFVSSIICEIVLLPMLYVIHNEIQNKKQALDNRLNQLLDKRKSIANIVKNTDIDEEQKKILIQQISQNNI